MKIKVFIAIISVVMGISFLSCILPEDEKSTVSFKSYFLGEDSFSIDGKIYDIRGKNLSANVLGKNITATINSVYGWKITSPLNGNNFNFLISKTSDDGITLSKDLPSPGSSIHNYFINYYNHYSIPYDGPEGRIRIYSLYFSLDDNSELIESESAKPGMFDEHFSFVYVTEPVNITGNWENDDTYWSYDCNFSKAGWYKICTFYDHEIGSNSAYSAYSSKSNIKLKRWTGKF